MDKKVKLFIKKLRKVPHGNAQKDLSKYYDNLDAEGTQNTGINQASKRGWIWALVSIVVVIAVVLPTTLVLTKPTASPQQDELHFCDDSQIRYDPIESIAAFNAKYGSRISLREDVMYTEAVEMFSDESGRTIGALISLYVFDDSYKYAKIYCYTGTDRIALGEYATFPEQTVVNGVTLFYDKIKKENEYYYYLHWEGEDIVYYATVYAFIDVSADIVLERFFPIN